jgi:hypothetical protein
MKLKIIQTIFRCFFSLVLLYLAKDESGPWTLVILFLMLLNIEVTYWMEERLKANTALLKYICTKHLKI